MFIVQAHQTSMELLTMWCSMAAFFLASGAALSQEVADGKINVQSACALNTQHVHILFSPLDLYLSKHSNDVQNKRTHLLTTLS
jgi:hypothetical protein